MIKGFLSIIFNDYLFSYLKKILVLFLILTFLFNGFIPKNSELKNSFVTAVTCVLNTIETNFYDKYSSIVTSVISDILVDFDIVEVSETQLSNKQNKNEDNQTSVPITSSEDNEIIITQTNTTNQTQLFRTNFFNLIYEIVRDVGGGGGNLSVNISSNKIIPDVGILFFILFSILVVRIKDTIAVLNNKRMVKNRLGLHK